jgi:hypothetical protein
MSAFNPLEIQALRATCRAAAMYHDSPATKGYHCLPWCFCGCERARLIREADVAICKLEFPSHATGNNEVRQCQRLCQRSRL